MKNGKKNGATNGEKHLVVRLDIDNAIVKATALGHRLDLFHENGQGPNAVLLTDCKTCRLGVVVDFLSGRIFGTALEHPCKGVDKNVEFKQEPMSDAHRKRISGPWKPPYAKR